MDGFIFAVKEAFWSAVMEAEFAYGRARRRIERKWVLRKKERTRWEDVWRYLDKISRRNWEDSHKSGGAANNRRLLYFFRERN